jgi:predicted nucleic acid-binding protein
VPEVPKPVVVDACVVLKWQLDDEQYIPQATALRDDFYTRGAIKAIAPHLLLYEIANGIATATRQKRLESNMAVEAMGNLLALGVELREVAPLRALGLALRYNLSAYDAAYLALAEVEDCELWTGDKALFQAVKDELPRVKWIGDYTPVATEARGGQYG